MILALGTPHRGQMMPELERFAIVDSPYTLLDYRLQEEDTGPEGILFTGVRSA
jgi:hypothetical protein